jgi:lysophospholipase L1-like esterase
MSKAGGVIAALLLIIGVIFIGIGSSSAASEQGPDWCDQRPGAIDVIAGSSSTGVGLTSDGGITPDTWSAQVQREFPHNPVHMYGGDHSIVVSHLRGLRTVPAVVADQPALVIIMLGANDWLAGIDPAAYSDDLTSLVKQIHDGSPGTTIKLVNEWNLSPWDVSWATPTHPKSAYTEAMQTVAAQLQVGYTDVAPRLPLPRSAPAGLFAPDYVHLSGNGHLVVATWLIAQLHAC